MIDPVCEPIGLPPDVAALIGRVSTGPREPRPPAFLHFHDVVEVVVFGQAQGRFLCDGDIFPVRPGMAAFVPAMRYHDFDLEAGASDWTLIQLDPYVAARLAAAGGFVLPTHPRAIACDAVAAMRLESLMAWLGDIAGIDRTDPVIEQLIGLTLALLCRQQPAEPIGRGGTVTQLTRLMPAIERLRAAPGAPISLAQAATACHLSPAYFSRRFAAAMGCGFADYVLSYRLHLASRRVAATREPLSEIGYGLGFSSPSHFTARFRERFGITPRAYRRSSRTPA